MPQCAVMAGGECWCWDPDLCYVPDCSGECLIGGYILLFCSLFPLFYNLDSSLYCLLAALCCPWRADAQTQVLSLYHCCGLFPFICFSALSPVAFPDLASPVFVLLSQSLVSHHQSWICLTGGAVQSLNLQPHLSGPFPWQDRAWRLFCMSGSKHGRCFFISVLVLWDIAIHTREKKCGRGPDPVGIGLRYI